MNERDDIEQARPAQAAAAPSRGGGGAAVGWGGPLGAAPLVAYAVAALIVGLLLAFWVAPTSDTMGGFAQKIFFYHVPIAEVGLLAFGVSFVAGILYLRRPRPVYDHIGLVSIRLGLFFSLLVMATGMIWGEAAWGVWWTWEPRLTTFLIACLLYCGYFVLRATVEDEGRRGTYAALFAIIAFIDVPITFFATRLVPEGSQLHPIVVKADDAGMDTWVLIPFLICMLGMTLLYAGLLRLGVATESLKDELAVLKDRLER
jgi:heme exporter protein C